jgi:hypothetical protein
MIKHPFQNETESSAIDELTVENRLDRVSLYGRVEITADEEGLSKAAELQMLSSTIVSELKARAAAGKLPKKIVVDATVEQKNPFV